ncbi:hypothetical protein [Spiribacter insolitus]|uniref:DUF429 domain-containing protein n=1 Tax=Spiribacter insolitus TaxID=3122417 RepID=A0ABV3T6F1_9GAMM
MATPAFQRYIGIDYSGAATPEKGLTGLRVYRAEGDESPGERRPTADGRRHWSRRSLAEWLMDTLDDPVPTLVGIDHGFAFPVAWHEQYGMARAWDGFLADFRAHYPTDLPGVSVQQVRDGTIGSGPARAGHARWRRRAEARVGAKSVFHFDVPGSVAKSTHAGLPWLWHLRQRYGDTLHAWPFDGWRLPPGRSAVAEIYPSIWSADHPRDERTPDQHDAYVVARTLQRSDREGWLRPLLEPVLDADTRAAAALEGWILGVT